MKRKGKGGSSDALAKIFRWQAEAGGEVADRLAGLALAVAAATVPQPMIEDAVSRFWEQTLRQDW